MQNMYPGIPFSPNTILTRAINDTDTVIYVADSNAFPDGPNLATIGTDESAETILYAQKGDGVLSGCLRGIEGKAKSWRGNDLIARNFTAYDYEALRTNLGGHLEAKNPHKVKPEQIGAAPEAHTHVPATFTPGRLAAITEGGQFTDSGKSINDFEAAGSAAAVKTALDAHIADDGNPHGVTASQVGAAAVSHTHDTADISGCLPITCGGTGATTAANAITNLGGVPSTRKVNNKALSGDITLTASDVGAASSSHTHTNMLTGTYGAADKTAGSSSLTTGTLYFMYT